MFRIDFGFYLGFLTEDFCSLHCISFVCCNLEYLDLLDCEIIFPGNSITFGSSDISTAVGAVAGIRTVAIAAEVQIMTRAKCCQVA